MHDVAANEILTMAEPPKLELSVTLTNGLVDLKMKTRKGFADDIEASSDLVNWTCRTTLTNLTGTLQFADPNSTNTSLRFYRLVVQ